MAVREIDLATARRFAMHAQRLSGRPPRSSAANVLDVIRSIRCVQLDPISVVARSPLLVLRSRLPGFRPAHLDHLLWAERSLFEYWAHAASIVLTEDLPIHAYAMRRYINQSSAWERRLSEWMKANAKLRQSILMRLRREGPLPSRALADLSADSWRSSGWTNERNVDRMLAFLWGLGVVMVAGRRGQQKLWDLSERVLPADAPRERLTPLGVTRRAAPLSLRALGVGTIQHIRANFTPGRYPELSKVLAGFERDGTIQPLAVRGPEGLLRGPWFVLAEDVPTLDRIEGGRWTPRTTLVSPFDNLIHDRARALTLFDLHYRMEIYVPKVQRVYGYYAMSVLDGDRIVGRVDPSFVRAEGRLVLNSVHAERGFERSDDAGAAVERGVRDLASWLGADRIELAGPAPSRWRRHLT